LLYVCIIFMIVTVFLCLSKGKNASKYWLASFMFCAALDAFSYVLFNSVLPNMTARYADSLAITAMIVQFISRIGMPYTHLMVALTVYPRFQPGTVRRLGLIFLIPPLLTLVLSPIRDMTIHINYPFILCWFIPFIILRLSLTILTIAREKDRKLKRNQMITLVILLPATLTYLIVYYISPVLDLNLNPMDYIPVVDGVLFLLFLGSAILYGAFGLKIGLEQQRLQSINQTVSRSAIVQTYVDKLKGLKAEAAKLNAAANDEISLQLTGMIVEEVKQMSDFFHKSLKPLDQILISPNPLFLKTLLEDVMIEFRLLLAQKQIGCTCDLEADLLMVCDADHFREVLVNLMRNAVEAIDNNGQIALSAYESISGVVLTIVDNGSGIAAGVMEKVFHPYFSTKHKHDNFGLGLPYCYMIVKKHGGNITISSIPGEGTTVKLTMPVIQS
jgi:signal transduction histidine kinase